MANNQNLKPPGGSPGGYVLSREEASKGGKRSAESKRQKKLLCECLQELMQMEYSTSQGKKLGSEMLSSMLMKKALSGDIRAFEVLRDTAGEKPVEKVMVADVDPAVIAEVEKIVNEDS